MVWKFQEMPVSPNFVAILTFKVVILLIAMDFITDIDRLASTRRMYANLAVFS